MSLALRHAPSALALAAIALLAAGCSTGPSSPAPTSSTDTDASPSGKPSEGASAVPEDRDADDIEAAWLDGGRSMGIVTWGSSSVDCQPAQAGATAEGQTMNVVLKNADDAGRACTKDLVPRAIPVTVPEGVDVTKDVEVQVAYGDVSDDVDLDGLAAAPQGPSDQTSSAGWFDDRGILLLTWGSSSCPPVVEKIEQAKDRISVTLATTDRVCTMDFAPRITVLTVPDDRDDDIAHMLRLTGDNLDGEIAILG